MFGVLVFLFSFGVWIFSFFFLLLFAFSSLFEFFFFIWFGEFFYNSLRVSWFDFADPEDLLLSDEWFLDYDLFFEVDYWWNWFDQQDDEVVIDDWGWTQDNFREDLFIEVEVSDLSSSLDTGSVFWLYEL